LVNKLEIPVTFSHLFRFLFISLLSLSISFGYLLQFLLGKSHFNIERMLLFYQMQHSTLCDAAEGEDRRLALESHGD